MMVQMGIGCHRGRGGDQFDQEWWGASADGGDGCHYNGDDHHDNDEDDNNGDGADGKWEHHSDGDCEVLTVILIATSWYIVSIFSS